MKVIIDIPKNFERDYTADKFKDFFLRIIANINYKGVCGRYEKEIAEMFLKAFGDSEERDNEPCCRCDSRKTNADRIRSMSDEELVEFIHKMEVTCFADIIGYANKDCGQGKISCRECRAKAPTILEWLQLEAE